MSHDFCILFFFFSSVISLCPVGTAQEADSEEIKIRCSANVCQVLGVEAKRILSNEFCSSLVGLTSAAHTTFPAGCWFIYTSWLVTFPMGNITWTVVTEMEEVVLSIVNSLIGHVTVLPSFILPSQCLLHTIPLWTPVLILSYTSNPLTPSQDGKKTPVSHGHTGYKQFEILWNMNEICVNNITSGAWCSWLELCSA